MAMHKKHMKKGGSSGRHHRKKGGSSKLYGLPQDPSMKEEPQIRTAVRHAQIWGRIIEALPDEETKQLARDQCMKMGDLDRLEEAQSLLFALECSREFKLYIDPESTYGKRVTAFLEEIPW